MFADLHLHTSFSDGTYSPEELASLGRRHGLSALALTDHDTVEGCARMDAACQSAGVEFVPGSELTAELDNIELHLLGYFIDTLNPKLLEEMAKFQNVRQNRIREMVARLNKLNIPLQADAVFAIANCRSPGRPHVGRALVQAGFCATLDEVLHCVLDILYAPVGDRSAGPGFPDARVRIEPKLVPTDVEPNIKRFIEIGLDSKSRGIPRLRPVKIRDMVDGGPQTENHGTPRRFEETL